MKLREEIVYPKIRTQDTTICAMVIEAYHGVREYEYIELVRTQG
jgi:hypothetical protein